MSRSSPASLHGRMNAFTKLFGVIVMMIPDPLTALVLAVGVTVILSKL